MAVGTNPRNDPRVTKSFKKQRGSHLVEFTVVAAAILGVSVAAIDSLCIAHKRNLVRGELERIALEFHGDPRLQTNFWSDPGSFSSYQQARQDLAQSFNSRIHHFDNISLVPITHTDPHDNQITAENLPVGYFPPGTSGTIVSWESVPVNNSHKCFQGTNTGSQVDPLATPTPIPPVGGGGGSTGSFGRYHGIIGKKSDCLDESKIVISDPDQTLKKLSAQYPTELTAAFETDSILFGKVAMAVTVPFYPNPGTFSPPPACVPSWSTASATHWLPGCGPSSRSVTEEDGCANSRTTSQNSCISCNFTDTNQHTACSSLTSGGWGTDLTTQVDECGSQRQVTGQCCTPTWQNEGTGSCLDDKRVILQRNPCDGTTRTTPFSDGQNCGQCVWIAAWASFSTYPEEHGDSLLQMYNNVESSITNHVTEPGCFYDYVSQWGLDTAGGQFETVTSVPKGLLLGYTETMFWPQDLTDLLGGGSDAFGGLSRDQFWAVRTADPQNPKTFQYSWFMDSSCKLVGQKYDRPICGFAGASWSPISLIWDDSADIKQDMTVVEFPLSPDPGQRFSLWQASERAPLLVYDPHKTGKVASAKQLFGSLAFGGVTKSLNDFNTDGLRTPWSNGYEALALLDADSNGKVDGLELNPLALWFDKNRNAVVESGELRPAQELGISALFYKDTQPANAKDVMVKIGYERKANGKLIQGATIDWFAQVFASQKEAADSLTTGNRAAVADVDHSSNINQLTQANPVHIEPWMRNAATFGPKRPKDISGDTTGYWAWWLDNDPQSKQHPGILALEQSSDGKIKGFSIVESMLKENSAKLKTNVQALPTVGTVTKLNGGVPHIQLAIIDSFGKTTGISSATLSDNGMILSGKTEQKTQFKEGNNVASAFVKYSWTAQRLFYKQK